MLIGYSYVVEGEPHEERKLQRDGLVAAGVHPDHIYVADTRGGGTELSACLKALRRGDMLVAWKLAGLGSDLPHLVSIVGGLATRGVDLRVLTGKGAAIDTGAPSGGLILAIFAGLAEFMHELPSNPSLNQIASPRSGVRRGGPPFKMTPAIIARAQAALSQPGTNIRKLCDELGISRQTLYSHLTPDGQIKPRARRLLEGRSTPG